MGVDISLLFIFNTGFDKKSIKKYMAKTHCTRSYARNLKGFVEHPGWTKFHQNDNSDFLVLT